MSTTPATAANAGHARHGHRRLVFGLMLIGLVLLALCSARFFIGTSGFGLPSGTHAGHIMIERARMLLYASVAGAALAVSGVALQALLRNALAEPYILGLSTGAGLGIAAQGFIAAQWAVYAGPNELGALLGAFVTLGIVFAASRRRGVIDRLGLLLTGVVVGTICGAMIMLLHHLTPPGMQRANLMQWMMGHLPSRSPAWGDVVAVVVTLGGGLWLMCRARAIDVATLDDDEALALGVHTTRLRVVLLLTASALAAAAVVIAGPVAFVGLVAPHLARLVLGPRHAGLLPGSAMLGAALLIAANLASEAIAHARPGLGVLPIGIFTALVGGPAFLFMLRPRMGRGEYH